MDALVLSHLAPDRIAYNTRTNMGTLRDGGQVGSGGNVGVVRFVGVLMLLVLVVVEQWHSLSCCCGVVLVSACSAIVRVYGVCVCSGISQFVSVLSHCEPVPRLSVTRYQTISKICES